MGVTNYPYGVSSYGIPLIGSGPILTSGKVFFVQYTNGANGTGRGGDSTVPLKTLAYAISLCTAGKGDVILLMPGHAEDIIAAGTITSSKSGVRIIGLGTGALRPTFTFKTATTATIAISGAQSSFENCIFDYTGIDAIATGINITGADVSLLGNRFILGDVTNQATTGVTLGTGAARVRIQNNHVVSPAVGPNAFITGAVAVDEPFITDNTIHGEFAQAPIYNLTVAWTNVFINRNHFRVLTSAKPAIVLVAAATGLISYNAIACNTISAGGSITAAGAFKVQNYATDTAAGSGVLDPTVVTL